MNRKGLYRSMIGGSAAMILLASCATGDVDPGSTATDGQTGGESSEEINVLLLSNPRMEDVQKLTEEHFTAKTGIKVNFTILPEDQLLDKVTQDIATEAGQYDVSNALLNNVQIFGSNGWLHNLGKAAQEDAEFDFDDIFDGQITAGTAANGELYGIPFYGESSFTMYRADVFEDLGLEMPDQPTWQQIEEFAQVVKDSDLDMNGICLRGQPSWSEMGASLTTVVNTFGGTWFDADWNPQVNAPEFKEATEFYVNLINEHGPAGGAQAGFTECLNAMSQSEVSMWVDSTAAGGLIEDSSTSGVAGKVGYARAPVAKTENGGWLSGWQWIVPETSGKKSEAEQFVLWASSKEYESLVGENFGWTRVPDGKRKSTYEIPAYAEESAAFKDVVLEELMNVDPGNPGVQPRPTVGTWYVSIPEFPDLSTRVMQNVNAAIAGSSTVDEALDQGQALAETIANEYR